MLVLKVGGNEIDQLDFLDNLGAWLVEYAQPIIIVHGGGKEISQLQHKFEIEPQYIDGLRVTDETSLWLTQMVLCGAVNKRIVEMLQLRGIEAMGLSGVDRGLVKARKMHSSNGDLRRVGDVTTVRAEILIDLVAQGVTPVIAPICLGEDGAYNVNADHVAGAVGAAVKAEQIIFLTNVKGVLDQKKKLITQLTPAAAESLIQQEIIFGGMLPKVRTALHMVQQGAPQVRITNFAGLQANTGTVIVNS